MNLYLIYQDENKGYDTFDSAVVCAPDETTARLIHPAHGTIDIAHFIDNLWDTWCSSPDKVTVKLIGIATVGVELGVVCASFNAG